MRMSDWRNEDKGGANEDGRMRMGEWSGWEMEGRMRMGEWRNADKGGANEDG